ALPCVGRVVRAAIRNALSAMGNSKSGGASELGARRRSGYQYRDHPLYAGDPRARRPFAGERQCHLAQYFGFATRTTSPGTITSSAWRHAGTWGKRSSILLERASIIINAICKSSKFCW